MPSSRFRADLPCPLVADASVWINLIATGRADDIIASTERPFAVTEVVVDEIRRGRLTGRNTAPALESLIKTGAVVTLKLTEADEIAFLELVTGDGSATLDDGEAATIVCAAVHCGTAVIDERKATSLITSRWMGLPAITAPDLILCDPVLRRLGQVAVNEALFKALKIANMHVPDRLMDCALDVLTPQQIIECVSLPARVRQAPNRGSAG